MFSGIDLYSDTMTRPSPAMLQAMVEAKVGDEQKGEDPTTLQLEAEMAALLGFSGAMFFPSATMCNEVALMLHCDHGDELLAAENCHLFFAETGGPAKHAGLLTRMIPTPTGIFESKDLLERFNYVQGPHFMVSKLVSVENTTNMGGGMTWSKETLDAIVSTSKELGMKLHMDGARLLNASVATGRAPKDITHGFDTVTVCFSKGLGCATGAVLAFDKKHWDRVRRLKQLMGGAMRQSGVLAAAALYALRNNIERLEEDHKNAKLLATGLKDISYLEPEQENPSTNMVFFKNAHPKLSDQQFDEACIQNGVRFSQVGPRRFRAVTHMDVERSDIEKAISILSKIGNQQ